MARLTAKARAFSHLYHYTEYNAILAPQNEEPAMLNFDQGMSQLLLYAAMATGAVLASMWLGIVLWTLRDVRARSRDVLAQGAAVLMVAVLNVFGLVLYLMLRPRETLSEAYERSLEEE